jgi:hypothetical protein
MGVYYMLCKISRPPLPFSALQKIDSVQNSMDYQEANKNQKYIFQGAREKTAK